MGGNDGMGMHFKEVAATKYKLEITERTRQEAGESSFSVCLMKMRNAFSRK